MKVLLICAMRSSGTDEKMLFFFASKALLPDLVFSFFPAGALFLEAFPETVPADLDFSLPIPPERLPEEGALPESLRAGAFREETEEAFFEGVDFALDAVPLREDADADGSRTAFPYFAPSDVFREEPFRLLDCVIYTSCSVPG
jgi:hypothetical protein